MDLSLGFVTWICLNLNWLLAVTGVMHEVDDAYSIRSTWSCYWQDLFLTLALNILILSIFYISMDLSTNYFPHFSGCWASFVCSCHYPRMLCHVFWSQVEYKIVCFIYPLGNFGQALCIRSCHEDLILIRKSHNCFGIDCSMTRRSWPMLKLFPVGSCWI